MNDKGTWKRDKAVENKLVIELKNEDGSTCYFVEIKDFFLGQAVIGTNLIEHARTFNLEEMELASQIAKDLDGVVASYSSK